MYRQVATLRRRWTPVTVYPETCRYTVSTVPCTDAALYSSVKNTGTGWTGKPPHWPAGRVPSKYVQKHVYVQMRDRISDTVVPHLHQMYKQAAATRVMERPRVNPRCTASRYNRFVASRVSSRGRIENWSIMPIISLRPRLAESSWLST